MKSFVESVFKQFKDYVFVVLAAILLIASLVFIYIQINQYLNLNSQKFHKEFLVINNYELINSDTASLSVRLNLLSSVDYIKCIRGYYKGLVFYESAVECPESFFSKKISVEPKEVPDLKINFTIGLSRQLSSVVILSIVFQALFFLVILWLGFYFIKSRQKFETLLYERALKTAHDIRSPLQALNIVSKSLEGLIKDKQLNVLNSASSRINDIANDLLQEFRVQRMSGQILLTKEIESLIEEKKVAYTQIEFVGQVEGNILYSNNKSKEIVRIVSNLINNSIEARANTITIILKKSDTKIYILIKDDGVGISSDNLTKIFQQGVTFGKEKGTGIGLFQAKKTIESYGGSIRIVSEQNKFTEIDITLPLN